MAAVSAGRMGFFRSAFFFCFFSFGQAKEKKGKYSLWYKPLLEVQSEVISYPTLSFSF